MANIKSAEKRARTIKVRTARNRAYKSAVKSAAKKFEAALVLATSNRPGKLS